MGKMLYTVRNDVKSKILLTGSASYASGRSVPTPILFGETMPKKRSGPGPKKFDESAKARVIENLATLGAMTQAAQCVGVTYETIRVHRKSDPEFDAACENAIEAYRDALTAEVHRRGVEGWDEPVYQKGELVGHKRVYSDRMLEMQAKRFIPEYRDKQQIDHNHSGGVLVVGEQPQSEKEWLAKYGDK